MEEEQPTSKYKITPLWSENPCPYYDEESSCIVTQIMDITPSGYTMTN